VSPTCSLSVNVANPLAPTVAVPLAAGSSAAKGNRPQDYKGSNPQNSSLLSAQPRQPLLLSSHPKHWIFFNPIVEEQAARPW